MKFRRTVSSVVASVFLVAAVLLVVLQLRLATYGMDKIRTIIRSFIPNGDSAIEIQAEGIESTLMRSLQVNNLSLSVEGKPVATVSNVKISLTLWDVIKLALGKGSQNLDVTVNDITIIADEKSIDSLIGSVGKMASADQRTESPQVLVTPGQETNKNPLLETGISATFRNLSIHAEYRGFSLASDGINASARIGAGLVLENAELNIPEIEVSGDSLGGRSAMVRDIRASVDSEHVAYISVLALSYSDIAQVSELSAIARLQDGIVSAALFVNNGFASIPAEDSVIRLSAYSTTVSANYGLSDSSATFSLSMEHAGFLTDDDKLDFSASSIEAEGTFDGQNAVSADIGIGKIQGVTPQAEIRASDIRLDTGLMLETQSALGQVSLGKASIKSIGDSSLKTIWAEGSVIDFSYSHQSLSTRLRTAAGGEQDDPLIGNFSFNIDASTHLKDITAISNASIAIRDIKAAALNDKANIVLEMDEKGNLHASLDVGNSLELSADYLLERGETLLNVYITDLVPALFKGPYEKFLSSVGAIGQETIINGNIVVSASASEPFAGYMRNLHDGSFTGFSFGSPFDVFSDGRISVNTAVRNLEVGSSPVSAALTLEATVDETMANIESLAVSTGEIRVSYSGTIDPKQLIPDGVLTLQRASDGSSLASLTFSYEKGERQHTFLFESPLLGDAGLYGNVNWEDLSDILVDGVLEASFFPEALHFSAEVFTNPLNINLRGDNLDLDVRMDEGILSILGYLDGLEVNPTDNMSVRATSSLVGRYDTGKKDFGIDLIDFSVLVSDSFEIGFDLSLTDHSIFLTDLKLGLSGEDETYGGNVDFTFSDIPSLLKLDTSSVNGTVNLLRSNSRTALRGAATDNQFYLDFYYRGIREESLTASLSILGQRENAFYASAKLIWGSDGSNEFNFNALYDDKKISFYDSYGKLGSLSIDDINLLVDLRRLTLDGSLTFMNEITGMSMETKTQSGKLTFSANGPEVSNGLLQAFVGLDYGFDLSIGLSDITLSDGYTMADTQVDMHLENGLMSLRGSLINGSYDMEKGYLDIEIDEDILFGFKAKGYIGDNLDLMVTDISFPLPVMNQFMGNPTFSFTNGLIEGDVLIQGPLSNPSLYGMVYCQSFEMTLFFLPDQIITAKNVALSLNDHSLLVSRTPMAGYSEADGRYFFGDVGVDIVLQGLGVETFDVSLNIDQDTPIDFWLPMLMGGEFEIRGDVSGYVDFSVNAGRPKLTTDIDVSSMLIDFRFDNPMPDWFYNQEKVPSDMDITMTTGHDVEFYYPEKDNPFINFTLAEDRTVRLMLDDGAFKTDGGIALKTGQVYYFQNDFIIREGSVDLSQRTFAGLENSVPFVLNLIAEITDYDSDGNKVIISMILQNATLDNINPRFTSNPTKSENEILAMLGQSVLASGALDRTLSLSSLARFARTAREALTRVGVIESNKNYSITGTVRNALGLDIFSARSNILSNVIIDALPGELTGRRDISMLARYLDRTSLFAGKYVGDDWFVKVRLMLKADSNVKLSNKVGHFLAKDLILDTEISLDWDTPMGTLSVFTQPRELSVFDILDTIGFSVTKQIQF